MTSLLIRLISDDEGQDLIEYMLLTATIALAGVVGMNAIGNAINLVYTTWDGATQALWEPEAPVS